MGRVTLITGGVRAGKSRLAQERAEALGMDVVYLATCAPSAEGMEERIARHRADRPSGWQTVEATTGLASHLSERHDAAIVDCLNLLVSHHLVAGRGEDVIHSEVEALLSEPPCPLFVVTNEVGSGVHPHGELALRFVDVLGTTNQLAARLADEVILMVAGLPLVVKPPGSR